MPGGPPGLGERRGRHLPDDGAKLVDACGDYSCISAMYEDADEDCDTAWNTCDPDVMFDDQFCDAEVE